MVQHSLIFCQLRNGLGPKKPSSTPFLACALLTPCALGSSGTRALHLCARRQPFRLMKLNQVIGVDPKVTPALVIHMTSWHTYVTLLCLPILNAWKSAIGLYSQLTSVRVWGDCCSATTCFAQISCGSGHAQATHAMMFQVCRRQACDSTYTQLRFAKQPCLL